MLYCVDLNPFGKIINIHIDSVKDYSRKWTKREREEGHDFDVYVAGANLNRSMNTHAAKTKMLQSICLPP
jgi:hypothetical protein